MAVIPSQIPSVRFPRLAREVRRPVGMLGRLGDHAIFYARALRSVPHAAVHHRRETIRLIAGTSMGAAIWRSSAAPW